VRLAWNDAVSACESFLNSHPEYEIHIIFAVLDSDIMSEGLKVLRQSGASVYKIATRDDWTAMDMPEQNDTFTLVRSFSDQQMEAMRRGHIPQAMEDKWFWYMDENTLFAHRSWTGFCIYKIEFHWDVSHIVTVNRDPEQYTRASIEEDRDNLNKLLDWWSQPGYDHYNEWLAETADAIKKQKNDITRAKRNTGIPEAKKEGQKDYDHQ
jgi:8-oxo-dGTP diphosphatase